MSNTKKMAMIAMVAAIYTALSLVLAPITYGQIQCRVAEALNLLPLLYPVSGYGVILGCFLTNLIGTLNGTDSIGVIDCIVGTLGTAISVWGVLHFKNVRVKNIPWLSMLMPVIANGVLVGIELGVLFYQDNVVLGSLISGIYVAIGEVIAMILGYFLIKGLEKSKLFEHEENRHPIK